MSETSCDNCFFGARMLCALDLDSPCTTYRADTPAGLAPPTQPSLPISPLDERGEPVAPAPRAPIFVQHEPVQLDLRELTAA